MVLAAAAAASKNEARVYAGSLKVISYQKKYVKFKKILILACLTKSLFWLMAVRLFENFDFFDLGR